MVNSTMVQEVHADVAENIGADMFSAIASEASPRGKAPTKAAAPVDAPDDLTQELIEEASPGAGAPVKAKPPKAKKDPESKNTLTPEDLMSPEDRAPALPDDTLPDAEIDSTFSKNEKARVAFTKERAAHKQAREENARLKESLSAAAAAEDAVTELAQLRETLEQERATKAQLEEEIGKIALSRSPTFRKQYDDRINKVAGRMVEALVSEGAQQDAASDLVRRLINESRLSTREEMLDDEAPALRGTLAALALEVDDVSQARQRALEEWKESSAALEELDKRARSASIIERIDETLGAAVQQAQKVGNPYFQKINNPAWDKHVDERVDTLRGILVNGDVESLAPLVAEGLTAPELRLRMAELIKKNRELTSQVDELAGGYPNFNGKPGGQGGARAPVATPKVDDSSSIEEGIFKAIAPPTNNRR